MAAKLECRGVALIMVLLVLTAMAIVAGPFAVSMSLHDRQSRRFEGEVKARLAAESIRNRAIAHLERTLAARESDAEAVELEARRPPDPARRATYQPAARAIYGGSRSDARSPLRKSSRRRGVVRRADLGEVIDNHRRYRDVGKRARDARNREVTSVDLETDPIWLTSEKGPSPKSFDPADDVAVGTPEPVSIEGEDGSEEEIGLESAEVSSSVRVEDEQGKINVNTAPPNLVGNLFGSSRLAQRLEPGAKVLVLEDGSPFRTDWDERTIDGAVVVVHPETGRVEAVTYRSRRGNDLQDCFRGAFLSVPYDKPFPQGSFVYDLRGYKVGHHQLRAHAEGGFAPSQLGEFATIEAIRQISSWQIASLFLIRFRGEGLTSEFLEKNGINARKLGELGLDPAIFAGSDPKKDEEHKEAYAAAVKSLRKVHVPSSAIDALRKARGVKAVIAFDARVGSLKAAEAQKVAAELVKSLERDRRNPPQFDRKYLEEALANLGEVYNSSGIETVLPEELELLRDCLTVSSRVPARWSEPQANLDPLPSGPTANQTFRAARPAELGGGALVRIRLKKAPEEVEFNRLTFHGKEAPVSGYQFAYPLLREYPANEALIQALERHPVNVNTASERVLRAVFTGVSGYRKDQTDEYVVTPAEAAKLATLVRSRVPLKGLEEFRQLLLDAAEEGAIGDEDILPLLLNAIQPNDPRLRVSTTGFCYATGDVYTIESMGVVRTEAGGEVASNRLREIVSVSSPEPLRLGLFSQADYQSDLFLQTPYTRDYPEDSWLRSVSLPGTRGHLVISTPLLLRNQISTTKGIKLKKAPNLFPLAGGELGTLRLIDSESRSQDDASAGVATRGDIYHFRNLPLGLELGPGEPFVLDISDDLNGTGTGPGTLGAVGQALARLAGARAGGGGAGGAGVAGGTTGTGTGILDLTNMPASVDFWCRFRSFPEASNREGMAVILDAGADVERNRISLLYDRSRLEFVARIYDSSLPDPSIPEGKQFVEVRAKRQLELETWYHLRLAWNGTYDGGIQLFIDGLPAGRATFSTELSANLPTRGAGALALKDSSALPARQGYPIAVRVGNEIIELEGGGQIRREKESEFSKWLAVQKTRFPDEVDPQATGGSSGAGGAGATRGDPERFLMRGPWNNRTSAPVPHPAGTPVGIHGYSLPIVRKIRDQLDDEHQVSFGGTTTNGHSHGGCDKRAWTPGGLTLADQLLPYQFPTGVLGIVHYEPTEEAVAGGPGRSDGPGGKTGGGKSGGSGGGSGGGGGSARGTHIAPLFLVEHAKLEGASIPGGTAGAAGKFGLVHPYVLTAELVMGGQTYNAADFFQREGVLILHTAVQNGGRRQGLLADIHYLKGSLPGGHPASMPTQASEQDGFVRWLGPPVIVPQRAGLKVQATFPLTRGQKPNISNGDLLTTDLSGNTVNPISVLVNGSATNLYPASGILEIRGAPAPWCEPVRPDLSTAPLFGNPPEDTVEWIRYVDVFNDRMLVGRKGGYRRRKDKSFAYYNTFRGYPEVVDAFKNQMRHQAGEPLRVVMELADGGAGYGDYVSIVTDDPAISEPVLRRIYHVSERDDGRIFVSLIDVDQSGREISGVIPYRNTYTPDLNPRLVKFPSGALPQVGTGRMVLFGEAGAGGPQAGGTPGGSTRRSIEEEETAGTLLDEVRRSRDITQIVMPGRGQRVKQVLAPLENGRLRLEQLGNGMAAVSGVIPLGRAVTRQNPLEILVVSVGRDPDLFAPGLKEGVLRIGEELFFFENPQAGDGKGSVAQGTAGAQGANGKGDLGAGWLTAREKARRANAPTNAQGAYDAEANGEQDMDARFAVEDSPPLANVSGKFEQEGFARIDDRHWTLHGFYEVFYYRQFGGGTFRECLRGQFQTPIVAHDGSPVAPHQVRNVSVRLKLVGRSLLGSRPAAHGMGDPVSLVPYLDVTEITGGLTDTGVAVRDTRGFEGGGYLLLDSGVPDVPFEIMAHTGIAGEGMLKRPLEEDGKGILRACFGTVERPLHPGMFAYAMPFRFYDRYQPEVESEALAYLQKSFRVPGAFWRSLSWRVRRPRGGQERLCDVVVAARIDNDPDWSEKPTNQRGGLFFFEDKSADARAPEFPIGVPGDEIEARIYFRYKKGSFQRINLDAWRDDWKETPVLEWLSVEYEKAGRILRHEEPPN
jgi:hypothetical protein